MLCILVIPRQNMVARVTSTMLPPLVKVSLEEKKRIIRGKWNKLWKKIFVTFMDHPVEIVIILFYSLSDWIYNRKAILGKPERKVHFIQY